MDQESGIRGFARTVLAACFWGLVGGTVLGFPWFLAFGWTLWPWLLVPGGLGALSVAMLSLPTALAPTRTYRRKLAYDAWAFALVPWFILTSLGFVVWIALVLA